MASLIAMKRLATSAQARANCVIHQRRALAMTTDDIADACNLNVVESPYPPIPAGPFRPLYEFVTENWKGSGGYLGDKVAIVDGSTGLQRTFQDYHDTSGGLAGSLRYELDVDETTTVALYCPNHVDYLPIALAVSLCGAKLTPINPMFTTNEVETILERSRSSVLIAHMSKLDAALDAARKVSHVKHVIIVTDNGDPIPEGTINLDSIRQHDKAFHQTAPGVHRATSSHAFSLPYSSGTTGLPKGVCLTHENLVANLLQIEEAERFAMADDHAIISPLPFFHIYAFTVSMLYSGWKGHKLITTSGRFDLERFCELVEEHRPQRGHLVPPILLGLAKHEHVDKYDLSSLRYIVSAAAPMSHETEHAVKDRISATVKQAWGMSELSPIGTFSSDFNVKSGSVGPLVSSTVGKIVDEQGKSLGPNEQGELLLKGPQVMMGYLDDPVKTADCLSESGWLRTGDVAYYDEEGFFFITDRIKEMIKVRGYPVAPAELEALLLTHKAIDDAAVIQVTDEMSGELPRAYVVKKSTADAEPTTEDDIYQWVKEQVAPYKRLDGGIVFVDSIPKSASGKILRRILRDEVKSS